MHVQTIEERLGLF